MRTVRFAVLLIACLAVSPFQAQIQRSYRMIASHTIEGKNYYFTALLKAFPDADSLVRANPELNRMAQEKQQRLEKATETHERIAAMKFSEQEIEKAGNVLAALYKPENVLGKIISEHILPSGCYQQYAETGAELIRKIWRQDAEGMNYTIDVYIVF